MRHLQGHTKDVRAVAFTPDGQLVSGGGDRTVRVWNPATGACTAVVKAKAPVYAVAVSPDGQTIAYAGRQAPRADSNFVYLCDAVGKPIGQFEVRSDTVPMGSSFGPGARPEPRSIWSLAFSADGQYLAAACRRMGGGQMLNGGGGRCWAIAPHASTDDVTLNVGTYAVTFAPAGTRFAVSRYHIVGFYDSPTKPEKLTYPLTPMWSNAIAFIPGSDFAVVGSNSFLYFMNAAKHEKPARVKTGSRTVAALSASPDGKTLIVGGRPGAVEVYDVATRALTTSYDFGIGGLHAIAFAPDGLTFAAAGDEGLVVCDAA